MMHSRFGWRLSMPAAFLVFTALVQAAPPTLPVTPATPPAIRQAWVRDRVNDIAKANTNGDALKALQELVDIAKDKTNKSAPGMLNDYANEVANTVQSRILFMTDAKGDLVRKGDSYVPRTPPDIVREAPVCGTVAVAQIQLEMIPPPGAGLLPVIAVDPQMCRALAHPNPAVRYWAAKALAAMVPELLQAPNLKPAAKKSIEALGAALAKENSSPVRAQMLRGLAVAGEIKPVVDSLSKSAEAFRTGTPDITDLDAATVALGALADAAAEGLRSKHLKPQDEAAALTAAANVASFAAQQAFNRKFEGAQVSAVAEVVNAAFRVVNVFGQTRGKGRIAAVSPKIESFELVSKVNDVTGSDAGPGQVQEINKDVPVPARVAPSSASK